MHPRPPFTAHLMVQTGLDRGANTKALLHGTGLSEPDLANSARLIAASQELRIARNLVRALGNPPGLGREIAYGKLPITRLGVYGYALLASPTLGAMLELGVRWIEYGFALGSVGLQTGGGFTRLTFDHSGVPEEDVRCFVRERDIAATIGVISYIAGGDLKFHVEITDPHEDRVHLGQIPNVAHVTPGCDIDALRFSPRQVESELPQADEQTARACADACAVLMERRGVQHGIASQVSAWIVADLARFSSMDAVAREMHIATRTLRRQLESEGTAFRELLSEVREGLAIDLLEAGLTVEQVANRLGYTEAAAFTRAFKRWTGVPPSQHRSGRDSGDETLWISQLGRGRGTPFR